MPIGSVFYYEEYDPAEEEIAWDDIVQVIKHTKYSGPVVKILFSFMSNKSGYEGIPSYCEIANGRAMAISDKKYMIDLIFYRSK